MENIKKEVQRFINKFLSSSSSRHIAQELLEMEVNGYRTTKTKLYFLTELRKSVTDKKNDHESTCRTVNCQTSEKYNTALFVIDEELEVIREYFVPEIKESDSLSFEDISGLHRKLDEILERFDKLDFGHRILGNEMEMIADDIDTLKQHFSLDKKSWFQFAFIKLATIGVTYGVEESIIKGMYSDLTQQVENAANLFIQ